MITNWIIDNSGENQSPSCNLTRLHLVVGDVMVSKECTICPINYSYHFLCMYNVHALPVQLIYVADRGACMQECTYMFQDFCTIGKSLRHTVD